MNRGSSPKGSGPYGIPDKFVYLLQLPRRKALFIYFVHTLRTARRKGGE